MQKKKNSFSGFDELLTPENKNEFERNKTKKTNNKTYKTQIKEEDYFMGKIKLLPTDTSNLIKTDNYSNFNLQLNKNLYNLNPLKDNFYKKKDKNKQIDFIFEWNKILKTSYSAVNLDNIYANYKNYLPHHKETTLTTDSRMVIGLGSGSVHEVSMTLHHIYGIPYIPAQAVKGTLRNYIIQEYFNSLDIDDILKHTEYVKDDKTKLEIKSIDNKKIVDDLKIKFIKINWAEEDKNQKKEISKMLENLEELKLKLKDFIKIFGSQDRLGEVIFLDAFSTKSPELKMDIITPHHNKYHSGEKEAPDDTENPVPLPFLTIAENTKFRFMIGSQKDKIENYKIGSKCILCWLKEALQENGVGAKTAVGYGYFQ